MSTTLKIKLSEFGITLVKGRTYRIEIDEDMVRESGSPINLGNAGSNNLVRWTATGFTSDNLTFSFGAGGTVVLGFDEDIFLIESDYFASDYIDVGYVSDTQGTISIYGEDSTLVRNYTFPTDDDLSIGSNNIVLSGMTLTDNDYYWISIPVDLFQDVFGITNNDILDLDFQYTGADPAITAAASMSSSASITCNAQKNVEGIAYDFFGPEDTAINGANFGHSLDANDEAIVASYYDGTDYRLWVRNIDPNIGPSGTRDDTIFGPLYTAMPQIAISNNYAVSQVETLSPTTQNFDVFETTSSGQTLNRFTLNTTLVEEFNYSADDKQIKMNDNGYFVFWNADGSDSIYVGNITGHDTPTVSVSTVNQPVGDPDTNFAVAYGIDEDSVVVAGSSGKINVYDPDTLSKTYSFSTAITNIADVAVNGDQIWIVNDTHQRVYSMSTGSLLQTIATSGANKVYTTGRWALILSSSDTNIYNTSTYSSVYSTSDTYTAGAIRNNSYILADENFDYISPTDSGFIRIVDGA